MLFQALNAEEDFLTLRKPNKLFLKYSSLTTLTQYYQFEREFFIIV